MRSGISFAILTSLSGAHAFWRMECRGRVGLARLDPLIDPGTLSQHVHSIHGSAGFSEKSTYEDLRNAPCTSCAVLEDMSVYWAPTLYFRHADGRYEEVGQEGGMLAYYFLFEDQKDKSKPIRAFPNDFRMIAGDSSRRNYSIAGLNPHDPDPPMAAWAAIGQTNQDALRQRAIGFNCLHYHQGDNEPALWRHYLPDKSFIDQNCVNGVRFEIMFPSCWNGRDTSSPDHKSHVAYPDQLINGNCPEGFDVKLPGLMYETIWKTYDFKGLPGEFVLSNGDTSGFGYHADFISGWDSNFLQKAVDQCRDESGSIYACPLFSIQSEHKQRQCQMPELPLIANEKVSGIVGLSLPGSGGNNDKPQPAALPAEIPEDVPAPTHDFLPAANPDVGAPDAAPDAAPSEEIPGGVFQEEPQPSEPVVEPQEEAPAPTPTPELPDPPAPEGYEIIRTDYITEGRTVSKIVVMETVEYVMLTTQTETVVVTATAGLNGKRDVEHHQHGHRHVRRHHRHGHAF